jgi:hypothetical protein
MSKLEKKIVREIFGEKGSERGGGTQVNNRRVENRERRGVYIWLIAYVVFLLLGVSTGAWLNLTSPSYLVTCIPTVRLLSYIVLISDVALWGLFISGFFVAGIAPHPMDSVVGNLTLLDLLFAIGGAIMASMALSMPSELWAGLHHPFSPGGMNITSIYTLINLPSNVTLSSSNSAQNLYLVKLNVNINGKPINATLVVKNATFSNPFDPVACVFYKSNTGAQSLPVIVHATPSLVNMLLGESNNGYSVIKLYFVCEGIPTKAVLITNYGNFTYFLPS